MDIQRKKNIVTKSIADIIRVIKFSKELLIGHLAFSNIGSTITVFGSARITTDNNYYNLGIELGKKLVV